MEKELPTVVAEIPTTDARQNWAENLERWSGRADARVVVFTILNAVNGQVHPERLRGLERAVVTRRGQRPDREGRGRFARAPVGNGQARRRRVRRGRGSRVGFDYVALLSAPLRDPLANVHTVQRRLVEAGVLALLLALGVGYGAAFLFARRIRRLEAAAERIAAGKFDEPVVDRSTDELGQLARAFDRMRLRLAQLERARREFIGNASHELRTPLFSLRGFLELLTDEELDEATRAEFLETMREQVDRLQRLAEDLLDLTRLDAGRMHIERQRVDLSERRRGPLRTSSGRSPSPRVTRWSSRRTATRRLSGTKAAS